MATKNYKRTGKRVEIRNGLRTIIRSTYIDDYGREFFKCGGEKWYIRRRPTGTIYAMFFPDMKYITEEY